MARPPYLEEIYSLQKIDLQTASFFALTFGIAIELHQIFLCFFYFFYQPFMKISRLLFIIQELLSFIPHQFYLISVQANPLCFPNFPVSSKVQAVVPKCWLNF